MTHRAEEYTDEDQDEFWMSKSVNRPEDERKQLYAVELAEPRVSISRFLPFISYRDGELHITKKFQR